jgi:hypothetical protein
MQYVKVWLKVHLVFNEYWKQDVENQVMFLLEKEQQQQQQQPSLLVPSKLG